MPGQQDPAKVAAAAAGVGRVRPGMRLALGSGTTVDAALEILARAFPQGRSIQVVVASERTASEIRAHGITPEPLHADAQFDLMLDGTDELTPSLDLTKGGGGALFREKFLARLSREVVIMADASKLVDHLGSRHAVPVEVVPFARPVVARQIGAFGFTVALRSGGVRGASWRTDNGNEILDLTPLAPITDPARLDRTLRDLPGVVETGLFVGLAHRAYLGHADGTVREIVRPAPA
ncbi:MAG: ribose 5-phosphate isomerase A [Thermoplasmata archaeon]|nr:ribose 5-phosphate isomerase A [Thermoplasmata archaeon]